MSDHSTQAAHAATAADHVAHVEHVEHVEHPTWKQYKWIALILTLITVVEVWVYYTPFKDSPAFAPTLIFMSVVKFAIVCLYYMHLKFDHKIFRGLFMMGLGIAICTVFALLFLFHKLSV